MNLAGRMAIAVVALPIVAASHAATAQQAPASSPRPAGTFAFVDVSVIRMDRERVEGAQTVLVTGDRIVAVGATSVVRVPDGATVVEGSGRFLLPGLTDAHVHLSTDMPWAPAREDFGDGPLYLAHGVTTVINLRGSPTQLEWRRRVETGELVGPTIYTAGEFVNEPRVTAPDEVAQEIAAQHRAGYDIIKFHEVWKPGAGFLTTTGLSRPAYLRMNEVARGLGVPLVGHAPVNLGLEALLQGKQPLAHLGMLANIYFLPLASNRGWLMVTAVAFAVLTTILVGAGVAAIVRDRRPAGSLPARRRSRAFGAAAVAWAAALAAVVSAAVVLPGGPLVESLVLRAVFTASVLCAAVASVVALSASAAMWRDRATSAGGRWRATVASTAALTFAAVGLVFWLPIVWRSSTVGVERLAGRLRDAGIPVQTTLVAYDAIGGPGRSRLIQDPAVVYLRADTRAIWRRAAQAGGAPPGYRYTVFMQALARTLHRAGVPLMAGTDAMGLALVAPGSSLHRELELLTESGLTRYEALRTATSAPAAFLNRETEFGTVEIGKRADLLLLDGDPLHDLGHLRRPLGVMVRGRWFTRERLDHMLAQLRHEP